MCAKRSPRRDRMKLGGYIDFIMLRLNSEDFSKFLLCSDTIFLTNSYESTHREVRKNVEIFRIFLNIHEFSQHFRSFSFKTFLYSEL